MPLSNEPVNVARALDVQHLSKLWHLAAPLAHSLAIMERVVVRICTTISSYEIPYSAQHPSMSAQRQNFVTQFKMHFILPVVNSIITLIIHSRFYFFIKIENKKNIFSLNRW